ncbi:hypothetical protein [Novosphingobium beihaiensis]|uniref:LPXTG cell wall anchor domain-containing protein n=1 Tax=Novosphingobium beihaiensis TaxID=2930389 RepID=A0ABT0BT79_9SPHN|nr:hypothetical protein [Novosphingobium beihaiensis]MCJ2188244.1 hypothetical protein [Novosphingobium beihaiensis]
MSYGDGGNSDLAKHVGCIALGLLGSAFVIMMLFGAVAGDCAPNADGTGCENDGSINFLMFPGSLILLIGIGIFAAWRVTKDRD